MRLKLCWKPCVGSPVRREIISPFCTAADEGISGTSLKHRDRCIQMINGCREGKIDLILVKSVSRFSMNVVDCITEVRALAALKKPVGVYFESKKDASLFLDSLFYFQFLKK